MLFKRKKQEFLPCPLCGEIGPNKCSCDFELIVDGYGLSWNDSVRRYNKLSAQKIEEFQKRLDQSNIKALIYDNGMATIHLNTGHFIRVSGPYVAEFFKGIIR